MEHVPAFFVSLAMIPIVGFAAIWLIGRMIAGDLEPLFGVFALAALVFMVALAVLSPEQRLAGPVIVVLISMMVFFPFAETQMEKQEMVGIDCSRIDKAHRELSIRPQNLAARFELARALHDQGLYGHAIALAENTLNGISTERDVMSMQSLRDKFRAEDSELRKWRRELKDPSAFDPVRCPSCGHLNSPGILVCEQCNGPYLLELARATGDSKAVYGRLVAGFALTAMLVVIGAWIGVSMPWPNSAIGLFFILTVVGGLLTWIYRPRNMRR